MKSMLDKQARQYFFSARSQSLTEVSHHLIGGSKFYRVNAPHQFDLNMRRVDKQGHQEIWAQS
jgi:hypothetical protein